MYIKVKVTPGSKKENLEKVLEDQFKISVKENAKMNMANRRVIELIAQNFGVLPGKVRLISGHHSPSKILNVEIEEKEK